MHHHQFILIWYSPFLVKYFTQGEALYPLRSTIFKYRTWKPDTVKKGISKWMLMGCFLYWLRFGDSIVGSLKSALNTYYLSQINVTCGLRIVWWSISKRCSQGRSERGQWESWKKDFRRLQEQEQKYQRCWRCFFPCSCSWPWRWIWFWCLKESQLWRPLKIEAWLWCPTYSSSVQICHQEEWKSPIFRSQIDPIWHTDGILYRWTRQLCSLKFCLEPHSKLYHWGQASSQACQRAGNQRWQHRWFRSWWCCWQDRSTWIIFRRHQGKTRFWSILCSQVAKKLHWKSVEWRPFDWQVAIFWWKDLWVHKTMS